MGLNKETVKVRKHKLGYEIRTEIWDDSDYGGNGKLEVKRAYTSNGACIGDVKTANMLYKTYGIYPEKRNPEHDVCSIGFSSKENKWYGWSHRALYGFGIGSEVKKGDCAYVPKDKEDYIDSCLNFWKDEYKETSYKSIDDKTFEVIFTYNDTVPNEDMRNKINSFIEKFPESYGRGEWKAETLEDAKEMAIAFAEGVS